MQEVIFGKTQKVILGLAVGIVLATVQVSTAGAVGLTNQSPTDGNYRFDGSNSGYSNPNDMAKHLLIASNHGNVQKIKLGLYFSNGSQKTVDILNANQADGGICIANGDGSRPLSSDFIEITFSDPNNSGNQTTYIVKGSDVCSSSSGNNQPVPARSKFYGSFRTPNSSLDTKTGKYRINMTVKFLDIGSLPDVSGNDQAISFKVVGPSGSQIGNIDTNESTPTAPNNSTIAKRVGNPGGVTHRFAFALPCDVNNSSDQVVNLYDSDNGIQPGDVKFYVAWVRKSDKVEVPLTRDEYTGINRSAPRNDIGDGANAIVAFRPEDGTSKTANVSIKNMDPNRKYVLVVKNVHGAGQLNLPGSSNFIYVGLPGDSIYGADNFDCPGWDATPKTKVNPPVVAPTETITWTHTVDNDGPDKTDEDIKWEIRKYTITGGTNGPKSVVDSGTINSPKPKSLMLSKVELQVASASDIGKKLCQEIRIKPESSESDVWQTSYACAKVVSVNGDFIPSVAVYTEAAEPGTEYSWHAQVTDGVIPVSDWPDAESYPVNAVASSRPGHTYSRQTLKESEIKWEVHKIIYKPTDNSTYDNSSTSAFACPAGTVSCTIIGSPPGYAHGKPPDGSGGTVTLDRTDILESNLAAGSRVCYVSSVFLPPQLGAPEAHTYLDHYEPIWSYHEDSDGSGPDTSYWYISGYQPIYMTDYHQRYVSNRDWRHSEYDCIMVAKRPRVQILGGDLSVGGLIKARTSNYADPPKKTFGNWVEYAALSGGENNFLASGAALSGGKDTIVNRAAWSRLTFANTDDTAYGKFSLLSDAPQLREYYSNRVGGPWTGGSLGGQHGIYSADNDLTLSGTGVSGSIVIVSSGKVTIDGDISYNNGPYSSFGALPQVVIIAKNIEITKDVKNIDAWLVTTGSEGSILTCNEAGREGPLSNDICSNKLTVNGPVITGNLYLRRTAGAKNESTRGDPAEVFNFRPDAYLWAYHQNLTTTGSTPRTVELTELPPRY